MLNPLPDLLTYSFFAPTLLRITAAGVFLYVAFVQWKRREAIAHIHFHIVGSGMWIALLAVLFHAIIGAMLLLGYYTQIAAIFGIIGSIKGIVLSRFYPHLIPISNLSLFLVAVILFSLLLTGAGLFAFDLPL